MELGGEWGGGGGCSAPKPSMGCSSRFPAGRGRGVGRAGGGDEGSEGVKHSTNVQGVEG